MTKTQFYILIAVILAATGWPFVAGGIILYVVIASLPKLPNRPQDW